MGLKITFKRFYTNIVTKEPLKIGYFGSDKFSITSLEAIYKLQKNNPNLISSIDIITPSPKLTGRGLKELKNVPLVEYGLKLNLPIFHVDSSNKENENDYKNDYEKLIGKYNLIIAASFGKLIPGFFLNSLKYGGINVHPSFLPMYKGASPIQYAILNSDIFTGVTIQTLHPTKFDNGLILYRSPKVLISNDDTYLTLRDKLAKVGALALVHVIKNGLYMKKENIKQDSNIYLPSLARIIKPDEKRINWNKYDANYIYAMYRAFGTLWTKKLYKNKKKRQYQNNNIEKRILLDDISVLKDNDVCLKNLSEFNTFGSYIVYNNKMLVRAKNGFVLVGKVKVEGKNYIDGAPFASKLSGESKFV